MDNLLSQLHFATVGQYLVPSLIDGVGIVLEATFFGFILATIVGVFIAVGRLFGWKPIKIFLSNPKNLTVSASFQQLFTLTKSRTVLPHKPISKNRVKPLVLLSL